MFASDSQLTAGECLTMTPSARKVLAKALGKEADLLPVLPEELKLLYKLGMPMDMLSEFKTIQQLKAERMVPEDLDCKDMDQDLAKAVWAEIIKLKPEFDKITEVPVNELDSVKLCWQAKLLTQAREYNKHFESVAVAELANLAEKNRHKWTQKGKDCQEGK